MQIFDCFLFNGELKMLNFRLHELDSYVDKFVIVESTHTFKGDTKETIFDKNVDMFYKFMDKIIYVIHTEEPDSYAWTNERNQRNFLYEALKTCNPSINDKVLLSDVDEIPDTTFLKWAKDKEFESPIAFWHNFYYYTTECRNVKKWAGTILINVEMLLRDYQGDFEKLRNNRWGLSHLGENGDYNTGGWHYSYFGDIDYIINKIQSFSHQEYNSETYKNPETIKKLIEEGKDLFFRGDEKFIKISNEIYKPKFINLLK